MEEIKNILGDSFEDFMVEFKSVLNSDRHPFDIYSEIEEVLNSYGLEPDYLETLILEDPEGLKFDKISII